MDVYDPQSISKIKLSFSYFEILEGLVPMKGQYTIIQNVGNHIFKIKPSFLNREEIYFS